MLVRSKLWSLRKEPGMMIFKMSGSLAVIKEDSDTVVDNITVRWADCFGLNEENKSKVSAGLDLLSVNITEIFFFPRQ